MEILWKDIFANAVKMKFLILVKDVVCYLNMLVKTKNTVKIVV